MDLLIAGWLVLVGLAAGFVSGLFGVGGGIVVVPALTLLAGLSFRDSVAASLLFMAVSAPLGVWRHARGGNVRVPVGLLLGATGFLGILAGSWIGPRLTDATLLMGFGALLVLAARQMAYAPQPRPGRPSWLLLGALGFAGGMAAKLFGIGGGILVVPALVLNGVGIHVAIGTSLVSVATNGLLSTLVNLTGDRAWVPYALPTALGALVGVQAGAWVALRSHAEGLRRLFSLLLLLAALQMARSGL